MSKTDTDNSDFIYDDSYSDYYLIYNNDPITKDSNQSQAFKIDYSVSSQDLCTINGCYIDENGYYGGSYYKRVIGQPDTVKDEHNNDVPNPIAPIKAEIKVDKDNDGAETDYTKELGLEVHTAVNTSAWKSKADASFSWNNAWGDRPADADQYFYVKWTLTSSHDSKTGQQFRLLWDESPVHSGSVVYMNPSEISGYKTPGTYSTTVVTKHPRSADDEGWKTVDNQAVLTVEWLSGYKQQFRVAQEAGVYIVPGLIPELFGKYIEDYTTTGGDRLKKGGQDLILDGTGVSDLRYDIQYYEYKNQLEDSDPSSLKWYSATNTYSVPERVIEITDGEKGDLVLSTVKGSGPYDWRTEASPLDRVLSDSDYSFNNLKIYLTEYDAAQVSYEENGATVNDWSEPYEHSSVVDYGDIEVWLRAEGESDYYLFKTLKTAGFSANSSDNTSDFKSTLNPTDTSLTEKDKRCGVAMLKTPLDLPEGTAGYKIKHKSEFFTTKLFVNAGIDLKSSNKVLSAVREDTAGGFNSLIKNNSTLSVTAPSVNYSHTEASKDKASAQSHGRAYPCSYELTLGESHIYASKQCIGRGENDSNVSQYTITGTTEEFPVLISGWGYNELGNKKLIDSGVFHDLLPYNFTVDKDSVYVQLITSNIKSRPTEAQRYGEASTKTDSLASGYFNIDFSEDWMGSGRTMMIITANVPDGVKATGFNIFYKMKTPMSNISANGTHQSN